MEIMKSHRDQLDQIAAERGIKRVDALAWLLSLASSAPAAGFDPESQAIIDRAVELGANASDLVATGTLWAAKSFITRIKSPKTQPVINVEKLSDLDLESFADTKNHPEISRERVRRTIERIIQWNDFVTPEQSIVLSATYIDKLRKELWNLSDGLISQISRKIIIEGLDGIECDPYGLGQFQNRGIPALSIGVFMFRDLLDELIEDPTDMELASRHYDEIAHLDHVS
jgi:hypothetical protein